MNTPNLEKLAREKTEHKKVVRRNRIYLAITAIILTAGLYTSIEYNNSPKTRHRYEYINNDTIQDKIIRTETPGKEVFSNSTLRYIEIKEDTLYGKEVDGKIKYLTKEDFDEYTP